jgi:polysaccharide export outer membrane protein
MAGLLVCATCAFVAAAEDPKPAGSGPAAANYVLGPDDEINIHALHASEIADKPFRVDSTGYITVPMIGRVRAGGRTVEQLERELTSSLGSYIREPEVAVRVTEFKSQPVSVLGSVKTPGVYHLRGRITLMEVLSAAGGLEPDSGGTVNITRRSECGAVPVDNARTDPSGHFSIGEVKLKPLMEAQNPANNLLVCANDVLVVPRAKLVYVIGEVHKPGGFVLRDRESVSILEALSMSEGLLRTAGAKNARILRAQAGQAQRQEIPVNVNQILAGKAEDVKLRPDDILFVPDSKPKTAAARGVEAAVQMATGVIIWRR